ncbi:MAG: c-type cytochrome [Chitinophagales bacterium]
MKRKQMLMLFVLMMVLTIVLVSCSDQRKAPAAASATTSAPSADSVIKVDSNSIPHNAFGDQVRYGMNLMLNTAYYIGPEGVSGKYLGNKMNCTNCHQNAGTKPFSFALLESHANYPQYRAREGKVLTLAERVNNCIMRPHNGRPLPLDSKEMVAFLSYFKWINGYVFGIKHFKGEKNLPVSFPSTAADPQRGQSIYKENCARCHGSNGQGAMSADQVTYIYPPLWGDSAYQPGSSMHRIIKMSQWLKANMPYDRATYDKPFLTDSEALDVAAFVNDDELHTRPTVKSFDYPHPAEKAIDYDRGPFADSFSEKQHKYGPYPPIIASWKTKGGHFEY